jgi:hypothetical protein
MNTETNKETTASGTGYCGGKAVFWIAALTYLSAIHLEYKRFICYLYEVHKMKA